MNGFDSLCAVLEKTITRNITAKLPPSQGWADAWVDPTVLYWFGISVDSYQDGRLYTAYSFGKVKDHKQLYRENLSTAEFDYDGLSRAPIDEADEAGYFELRDLIKSGRFSPSALIAEDREDEEEDEDEDEEFDTEPPTLLALALIADRLQRTPSIFPMPLAPSFSVTLSNDYETGTWPATLADLAHGSFEEWTDERLGLFWGDSIHLPLARRVRDLVVAGRDMNRPLSEVIR